MHQTLSADVLPKLINTVVNFTIIFVSTVIIVLFKTNGLVFNPASETKGLCNLTALRFAIAVAALANDKDFGLIDSECDSDVMVLNLIKLLNCKDIVLKFFRNK